MSQWYRTIIPRCDVICKNFSLTYVYSVSFIYYHCWDIIKSRKIDIETPPLSKTRILLLKGKDFSDLVGELNLSDKISNTCAKIILNNNVILATVKSKYNMEALLICLTMFAMFLTKCFKVAFSFEKGRYKNFRDV